MTFPSERLEILRRISEKGITAALDMRSRGDPNVFVGIFQHLLNEIEVLKKELELVSKTSK